MELLKKEETLAMPGSIAEAKFGGGKARYNLIIDSTQAGVEQKYFWISRFLTKTPPFGLNYREETGRVLKVKDIYTAGETSSYWGSVEQRRGAQIDKFQQIMANIGNMLKTLFQLVRELRIMDERLDYYERSNNGEEPAEVALKSIWVDLVEGGAKNPGSVIGLGAQVGFVILPDLFYSIHPKKQADIESDMDKLKEGGINRKVREVLSRKLLQYLTWKEKTYHELTVGREFKLKYMLQHYHVIKLYLNWLRPYLRNVKRLQMKEAITDKDIIASFETSKIELELLAIKDVYEADTFGGNMEVRKFVKYHPCVRVRINFVAIPELSFQQDYQKGALHRGRTEIVVEGFGASEDDIKKYMKSLDEEDMELLGAVDASILALRDDLEYYLEKGGQLKKKEEKPVKRESIFSPFTALVSGLRGFVAPKSGEKAPPGESKTATNIGGGDAYLVYKVFKQSNGMMAE